MIYNASGKPLRRAIGFTGELVADGIDNGKWKPANAIASKTVTPMRGRYTRNIPPVGGRDDEQIVKLKGRST